MSIINLCQNDAPNFFEVDLFNDFKKTGDLKFIAEFVWKKPDPPLNPKLNNNCRIELIIEEATFIKDVDFIGK